MPQGSALGHILFNFVTHNIEEDIVRPAQCEILKYADDLIIVWLGDESDKQSKLQNTIDKPIAESDNIKLRVRPVKCNVMHIRHKSKDNSNSRAQPTTRGTGNYTINGVCIKEVNKINILGVHITRTLTLDKETIKEKAELAARRLQNIRSMEIIHYAKKWRVLIKSTHRDPAVRGTRANRAT